MTYNVLSGMLNLAQSMKIVIRVYQ